MRQGLRDAVKGLTNAVVQTKRRLLFSKGREVSNLGRHVYGVASAALGLIGLIWGEFASLWQLVSASTPNRKALAYVVAFCLLAAGIAIQWRRTARISALVLSLFYFIFALLWLPRVIGFPQIYGTWNGLAEELALSAAGLVVYASGSLGDSRWSVGIAQLGRIPFGLCAVSFGIEHFTAIPQTPGMIPKWIPPGAQFWAVATGVAFLLAGMAILSGFGAALASQFLTAMFIVFGVFVWLPTAFAQPHDHMAWAGNAINLAATGAAWVIADFIASRTSRTATAPRSSEHEPVPLRRKLI